MHHVHHQRGSSSSSSLSSNSSQDSGNSHDSGNSSLHEAPSSHPDSGIGEEGSESPVERRSAAVAKTVRRDSKPDRPRTVSLFSFMV